MRFLVPALGLVCLVSSCTLNTDYFSEYRGVNLLGNYDFNALQSDGTTPKWALATDPDFMLWQSVTDPDRPTEAVYRLEILNLIPNGDFDATPDGTAVTSLPTGWSTTYWDGTAPTETAIINFGTNPSNTIHNGSMNTGRAMGWDSLGTGNQLRYALSAQVLPSAWRQSPVTYLFRVELINVGTSASVGMTLYQDATNSVPADTLYNAPDWTVNTVKLDNSTDNTSIYSLAMPFLLETVPLVRNVAFGPNSTTGTNAAIIDNVRLLPRSEPLKVTAEFGSLTSGVKPLLPGSKSGMYVFTIDVKNDPNAGTLNHYQPKAFTVFFTSAEKTRTGTQDISVVPPTGGWATWTTLTFNLGFDFVNSDSDLSGRKALTISLSPTVGKNGEVDVGTVLVSRPTLTFNP